MKCVCACNFLLFGGITSGDGFGLLCLLERTQRVALAASCGYHLQLILIEILAWSANSSGGKNPPSICMHITKDVLGSVQL